MSLHKSYRVQDGCWNCKSVFCYQEIDQSDEFYCKFGAPERPKSGGLGDEPFYDDEYDNGEEFMRHLDLWDEWREGREVESGGICDEHKKEAK